MALVHAHRANGPPVFAPLRHELSMGRYLPQVFVASGNRLGEGPSAKGLPNPPYAVVKVHRVVQPPRAVVAPKMVRVVRCIDSKRGIADRHLALLPMGNGKEGASTNSRKPWVIYREGFEKPFESFVNPHRADPTRILPSCCQVGSPPLLSRGWYESPRGRTRFKKDASFHCRILSTTK